MSAGKGWTGVQLLVKIGKPGSTVFTATYGNSIINGGLKLITALIGEPSNLIICPTSRDGTLAQNRQEEKKKYYGSSEDGVQLETSQGATGSINITLARDLNNAAVYEPSADIAMYAAATPNELVFMSFERPMGFVSPGNYRYHYLAGIFTMKSDGQDQTDATSIMRNFTISNSGDVVNGYLDRTV
jgi:hypothetical protein